MARKERAAYNAYMRTYLANRYKERRAWAIARLGGKCVKCGKIENLEFDHRDRKVKSRTIANILIGQMDRLVEELGKCQLLCSPCHQEKTSSEIAVPHGGGKKGKHNCKCYPCKTKSAEYSRNRRASRGGGVRLSSPSP